MDTYCSNCRQNISADAAFCAYCGVQFAEEGPPCGGPGWYPHQLHVWQQRYWDGTQWVDWAELSPDFVAAGIIGAVFVFPHGVAWGGGMPIRKAQKLGGLSPLIDDGDLSVATYNAILRIQYSEPSVVSNGSFSIVVPGNATSRFARFKASVVFDKKQVNAFRMAYGMIDARCRQVYTARNPTNMPLSPPSSVPTGESPVASRTPASTPDAPSAGWYLDPTGRHRLRYFDGKKWTDYASDRADRVYDPL